jgi:hemerythrin-like domain-containing protein
MPVQIGAQAHNFSDPTGLLSDCHRRIEMFLGALERVATVVDRPLTEETRAALESALRYFREAAPKHTADEEESLFPRLRQIRLPDVETAIEALERLEHEHLLAASLHAEVEELGQRYLATESLEATDVKTFRKAIPALVSIYKQHISIEDELVFPLAARLLSSIEKSAIADEMAARRKVRLIASI